jgi:ATP-dependent helicase/nuclease subunit A
MSDHLTVKQKSALQRNLNISVTAGAGTGKTSILVERYLDIVLNENIDIKNILAITFTDKAAGEITERIIQRTEALLAANSSARFLQEKLVHLRRQLSYAYISTIHSFCRRILHENPLEAGLDPDFSVVNDLQMNLVIEDTMAQEMEAINAEQDQWIELFRNFGVETVKNMLRLAFEHRFEMEMVMQKYQEKSPDLLFNQLAKSFLLKVEQEIDSSHIEMIERLAKKLLSVSPAIADENEKARAVMETLTGFVQEDRSNKLAYWRIIFRIANLFTTEKSLPYKNVTNLGRNEVWNKQCREILLAISDHASPIARWQQENISMVPGVKDQRVLTNIVRFIQLYQRFLNRYNKNKSDRTLVDFDDLQLLLLRVLEKNEQFRKKISDQFKYIIIDEFQDTNWLQWKIISLLSDSGDISQSEKQNKYFIVGDPKQSIYGFRNADVRVFNYVKQQFAQEKGSTGYPGNIIFDQSYRFKNNLINFINFLFAHIMETSGDNEWEVNYQSIVTERKDREGGEIDFALIDNERNGSMNQEEFIASRIQDLVKNRGTKYGDIAILLRTRAHLSDLEEQLWNYNIPFRTVGGIGFYQRQEIYDLYYLIKFLINPDDDLALVGILRSPFVQISDETVALIAFCHQSQSYWQRLQLINEFYTNESESHPPIPSAREWDDQPGKVDKSDAVSGKDLIGRGTKGECIKESHSFQPIIANITSMDYHKISLFVKRAKRWLKRRERIGFSELLEEVYHESYYRATLSAQLNGEQLLANLDKIVKIAADYEKSGFMSISDFLQSLKKLINTQIKEGEAPTRIEDEETVKIITIHQSKGLEFPIVFVPYLEQKIEDKNRNIYFDQEWGIIVPVQNPAEVKKEDNEYYLYQLVGQKQKKKELAELKRLLYVGCTRAKDHLILTGNYKKNISPHTPLAWILQAFNRNADTLVQGDLYLNQDTRVFIWREYPGEPFEDPGRMDIYYNLKKIKQLANRLDQKKTVLSDFLQAIHDHPKGEIFSATQLVTFMRDRKQYFKRYHLGFFESDYDYLTVDRNEEDLILLKGKFFHKFFERYPDVNLESLFFEFEIFDQELIEELKKESEELAKKIRTSSCLSHVFSSADYKNEQVVTMSLSGDFLTGTLDRIFKQGDGIWQIIDYKTNNIGSSELKVTAEKYSLQMDVYALLLSAVFPEQVEYPVNIYFTKPDKLYKKIYSRDEIKIVRSSVKKIIDEIKKSYF